MGFRGCRGNELLAAELAENGRRGRGEKKRMLIKDREAIRIKTPPPNPSSLPPR
jgi:hypothetical protein